MLGAVPTSTSGIVRDVVTDIVPPVSGTRGAASGRRQYNLQSSTSPSRATPPRSTALAHAAAGTDGSASSASAPTASSFASTAALQDGRRVFRSRLRMGAASSLVNAGGRPLPQSTSPYSSGGSSAASPPSPPHRHHERGTYSSPNSAASAARQYQQQLLEPDGDHGASFGPGVSPDGDAGLGAPVTAAVSIVAGSLHNLRQLVAKSEQEIAASLAAAPPPPPPPPPLDDEVAALSARLEAALTTSPPSVTAPRSTDERGAPWHCRRICAARRARAGHRTRQRRGRSRR